MSVIYAKPIVEGKFWIVEQNGEKIGTFQKKDNNKFILSSSTFEKMFNKKEELTKEYGVEFLIPNNKVKVSSAKTKEIYGYPTSVIPHNIMYDVKRKLPLFTKSSNSKSLFCAGYYIIGFANGWSKSFCPKAITLERYPYKGPFKTDKESKEALLYAKSD